MISIQQQIEEALVPAKACDPVFHVVCEWEPCHLWVTFVKTDIQSPMVKDILSMHGLVATVHDEQYLHYVPYHEPRLITFSEFFSGLWWQHDLKYCPVKVGLNQDCRCPTLKWYHFALANKLLPVDPLLSEVRNEQVSNA